MMIKRTFIIALLGFFLALSASAESSNANPLFYGGVYGGYGNISGAYSDDGNFTQGHIALGVQAFQYKMMQFGVEVGAQSGNTMRLNASQTVIDNSGGLPVQSTLKPMVDILLTFRGPLLQSKPLSYFLKGGAVYRQLQLDDRTSTDDSVKTWSPELQLGLGYNVTKEIMLVAYYQGIYSGSNANVQLNSVGDTTISQIPSQQAGFLGVESTF